MKSLPFVSVFVVAFVLALFLTPLAGRLGRRWGLVDRPGGRRAHRGEIPRTGGIALFGAFTITLLLAFLLFRRWLPVSTDPEETTRLAGLLVGSTFAFAFGLLDDKRELSWRGQITVQLVCSAIAIVALIFIERVNNPFSDQQIVFSDLLVWALTAFWFLGGDEHRQLAGRAGRAGGGRGGHPVGRAGGAHAVSCRSAAVVGRCAAVGAAGRDAGLPAVQLQPGAHLHGQQRVVFPWVRGGRAGHHRRRDAWPPC